MSPPSRYALYYAPAPGSALGHFGARWLGRDAAADKAVPHPALAGFAAEDLLQIIGEPRRYGFHGTLKAPFALADGRSESELADRLAAFAAARQPFTTAPLVLAEIGGFLALVPREQSSALHELAAQCVHDFDDFRAPATATELARRRAGNLSQRQNLLLARWGYPYVMEEFRFHLTLTDKLPPERRKAVRAALAPLVASFPHEPFAVDGVTLFVEHTPGEPFTVVRRFPFAA